MRGFSFARGPSRGPLLLDPSHLTICEGPVSPEVYSHPVQSGESLVPSLRHTYSSYASGEFAYLSSGVYGGGPPRGLVWSAFTKFPVWCEALFWWLLPLLLFLFLFILYSAGTLLLPKAPREDYGIVIDAGSHGSRLNIFKWEARVYDSHNPLTGPVSLPTLADFRVYTPGVEIAFAKPQEGRKQLQQMLRDAAMSLTAWGVNTARWGEIPIYLKATAGMRTLAQDRRDTIMRLIREAFHEKSLNPFHFKNDFARVISGEEEGVYGWVAVNTERNTLGAPPEETLGALDMGGSSTQMTFSPVFTSILEDFNSIHLGNTSLRLYSHSFLGYGWADALRRVNIGLAAENLVKAYKTLNPKPSPSGFRVSSPLTKGLRADGETYSKRSLHVSATHPCFPSGHSFVYSLPPVNQEGLRLYVDLPADTLQTLLLIMGVPRHTRDKIVAAATPKGVQARHKLQDEESTEFPLKPATPGGSLGGPQRPQEGPSKAGATQGGQERELEYKDQETMKVKVKFTGTGDFQKCHAIAQQLFFNFPCFINRCSFNGVYQPRILDSKFLAFGQYAKVWAALKLPASPPLSAWKEKTREICGLDEEAIQVYRQQNGITSYTENSISKLCWKATWSFALLVDGFGFDVNTQQISFSARRQGDTKDTEEPAVIGWALGSMIVDVNLYPWGMPERDDLMFYLVAALAVAFAALLVGAGHLVFKREAQLRALPLYSLWQPKSIQTLSAPPLLGEH